MNGWLFLPWWHIGSDRLGIIFSGFVPLCCGIQSDRHHFIICVGLEMSQCATTSLPIFDTLLSILVFFQKTWSQWKISAIVHLHGDPYGRAELLSMLPFKVRSCSGIAGTMMLDSLAQCCCMTALVFLLTDHVSSTAWPRVELIGTRCSIRRCWAGHCWRHRRPPRGKSYQRPWRSRRPTFWTTRRSLHCWQLERKHELRYFLCWNRDEFQSSVEFWTSQKLETFLILEGYSFMIGVKLS